MHKTGALVAVTLGVSAFATCGFAVRPGVAALAAPVRAVAPTWHVMPTHAGIQLNGISCVTAARCVAVGEDLGATAVALGWNGVAWTVQKTPKPSGAEVAVLTSVACSAANSCVAVGYAQYFVEPVGTVTKTLIERWNGSTWAVQASPNPGQGGFGVEDQLTGVACVTPSNCFAVGDADSELVPMLLRWNGTTWSIGTFPIPEAGGDLNAITCRSASWCEAVGDYFVDPDLGPQEPLAAHWNGSAWSLDEHPARPGGNRGAEFAGIACPSTTRCFAVGSNDGGGRVLEQWNGHAWSIVVTPAPTHMTVTSFSGISCLSVSNCVATGSEYPSATSEAGRELVDRWNGKAWSTDTAPGKGTLAAVACNAPTTCTAAGATQPDSFNDTTGLIERSP
ncbi:MAG TPA: hypothetical protein VGO03_18645 [Acidimicrobiia bacterium]|jgi:hypothetical protein